MAAGVEVVLERKRLEVVVVVVEGRVKGLAVVVVVVGVGRVVHRARE